MNRTKKILFLWVPPVIWAALIFLASSFPVVLKTRPEIPYTDKILHFLAYLPLGLLVGRALYFGESRALKNNFFVLTIILCALYGLSDEFHQLFVLNRNASLWDALADILGSCAGLFVFIKLKKG